MNYVLEYYLSGSTLLKDRDIFMRWTCLGATEDGRKDWFMWVDGKGWKYLLGSGLTLPLEEYWK